MRGAERSAIVEEAASPAAEQAAEAGPDASAATSNAQTEPVGYLGLIEAALRAREAGEFPEARALLERAHALFPNARTLRGLGVLAMDLHEYADAERLLQNALDCSVRPLDPELRAVTITLLERARSKRAEMRASAQVLTAPMPGKESRFAVGPSADAADKTPRPNLPARPATEPRRMWKNPWLWSAVGVVVVGGTLAAVLATRPQTGYERGSSDMAAGL
jgi:hypothetical protein